MSTVNARRRGFSHLFFRKLRKSRPANPGLGSRSQAKARVTGPTISEDPARGARGDGPESDGAVGESRDRTSATVSGDGENSLVDLARIGWLATVVACLIAVVILALQGYYGYAGVTLAVAISAGINLF